MIIGTDILIAAVFHSEAVGNGAELNEAEPFIKMAGVDIAFHNRIELHHAKAEALCLNETIAHKLFADVLSAAGGIHGVAGIAYMPAAADVVRMQNIESFYPAVFLGNSAVCLGGEKLFPALLVKELLCGKAMPSSTTSFQMRTIAFISSSVYSLTVIFIAPQDVFGAESCCAL